MEWIENGVGALSEFVDNQMSAGPLKDLLVDGIIGGVGSVIVFFAEYIDIVPVYFFHGRYGIYGSCGIYHG